MTGPHDDTRARLLHAASEVFAEVGYQAATIRAICARADANIALVNYHFRDKLGLYTALLQRAAEENEAQLRGVRTAPTPEEGLRRFVRGMMRQLSQRDGPAWWAKVMGHELVQQTPALAAAVEHVIARNAVVLCETVGGILHRPSDDRTTRLCAVSIIGQIVHYVHAGPVLGLLWPDVQMTDRQTVHEVADHIIDFSLKALRSVRRDSHPTPARRRLRGIRLVQPITEHGE
jgi:AcrR family transcriptional regulator